MEKDYPRTALTLEAIFGIIFGVSGIGHIYAGYLFSGIIIMLSRFALIGLEWVIFGILSLATFGLGFLFGFLPFFVLTIMQNVIFGIISVYALKQRASESFARICVAIISLIGGFFLLFFFQAIGYQNIGLSSLFVSFAICYTALFVGPKENDY
jgi:hypothetical protein